MATQPPQRVADGLSAPQHYVAPSAREVRAQAVQRLQVGLFGIAAILLIVGLANIIKQRALQAQDGAPPAVSASSHASGGPTGAGDPLADVGAVPSAPQSNHAAAKPSAASPAPHR